jgi:hypothetical protein
MLIVAGPPGSGKTVAFPLATFGVDFFNVDDRCAALNQGSYRAIPPEIRQRAAAECRAFIEDHIAAARLRRREREALRVLLAQQRPHARQPPQGRHQVSVSGRQGA